MIARERVACCLHRDSLHSASGLHTHSHVHSGFSEQASIEDFPLGIFVRFVILPVYDESDEGEARCKNESSDL